MTYQDYYNFTFSFNDNEIDLAPEEISFSLSDSIYSLYNYGNATINDISGYIQEFLGTIEGAKIRIGYGTKEKTNTCEFVIKKDELPEIGIQGYISGQLDINLIHSWYQKQQIRSKAYKKPISSIVTDLTNNSGFSSTDIESTGNDDYWYQMMITDAKFINEILLPNAFSSSRKSPFYAYITNDNIFHLKSLNNLLSQQSKTTIYYTPPKSQISNQPISSDEDYTLQIRRWHSSSDNHRPFLNRRLFTINRDDGSITETDDDIISYINKGNLSVPIMNHDDQNTGYQFIGFTEEESGAGDNNKGQKINPFKEIILLEHFLIIMPLNPNITSGNTINLQTYITGEESRKKSSRFNGKYIVENCEHIWNKDNRKGQTKLIIGREYIGPIPATYLLKPKLL